MKITAVIVAAGNGTRMGGVINKVFLPLGNNAVIDYTINSISRSEKIDNIILVTREDDIKEAEKHKKYACKPIKIVKGGKTRQESVRKGICAAEDADIVVIHDGARALITTDLTDRCIEDCIKYKAAAAGVICKDTLKQADENGFIDKTLDREITYCIQTPQVFYRKEICEAHEKAVEEKVSVTDDCALYEKYIGKVKITKGSYDNIKITTPDDMIIAKNILKNSNLLKLINGRRKINNAVKILVQQKIIKSFIKRTKNNK